MGHKILCDIYGHGQFVGGVDICKCVLRAEQVNLVVWLCVRYFYDHTDINSHTNFFSTAMTFCLHDESTYWPRGCHMHVVTSRLVVVM